MWPIDDSTMKSGPSMAPMVLALAGDSTMTRALPMVVPYRCVHPWRERPGAVRDVHDVERIPARPLPCQETGATTDIAPKRHDGRRRRDGARQSAAGVGVGVGMSLSMASSAGDSGASPIASVLRLEKAMAPRRTTSAIPAIT